MPGRDLGRYAGGMPVETDSAPAETQRAAPAEAVEVAPHRKQRAFAPAPLTSPWRTRWSPGRPYPQGATCRSGGVNFALFSEGATAVDLCLFDASGRET